MIGRGSWAVLSFLQVGERWNSRDFLSPQDWGPLACSCPQCEQKVEYPKHERGVVLPSLQVPKIGNLVLLVVSTKVDYPKDVLLSGGAV